MPEVLADAIADVTGVPDEFVDQIRGIRAVALVDPLAPAPSLDDFLTSLGTPAPQPAATGCFQTYQACLSGCGGNAACEQTCQCDYYECRGMDRPTFCL